MSYPAPPQAGVPQLDQHAQPEMAPYQQQMQQPVQQGQPPQQRDQQDQVQPKKSKHTVSDAISDIFLIVVTIFIPPLGVFFAAGCGADLLVNLILIWFGVFPAHVHAFWILYQYITRSAYYNQPVQLENGAVGSPQILKEARFIFSERVQFGGRRDLIPRQQN